MTRIAWTEKARADLAQRDASSLSKVDVDVVWEKTRKAFSAVRAMDEKGLEDPTAAHAASSARR